MSQERTHIGSTRSTGGSGGPAASRPAAVLTMALVVAFAFTALGAGSARALPPAPPEFYGVSPTTGLTLNEFRRFSRANIGTVRVIFFWPAVQRNGGHDWNAVDGSVINASYAGVRLFPKLMGSPKHISADPYRPPLDSAADRRAWQDFVRRAVERYGPNGDFWREVHTCNVPGGHCRPDLPYRPLRVWQAWSEPNLGTFWQPRPSPQRYAELLELTSDAVHGVDPGAEVIAGGMTPARGGKNSMLYRRFINRLYRKAPGIASSFEGLAINPYSYRPRGVRRIVKRTRRLTRKRGDGQVPLWINEVGWSTKGPKSRKLVTSRKGQARRLARTFRFFTRKRQDLGIELASWYTNKDGQRICDWCAGAGLFNKKMKPKPAWRRYKKIARGKR